MRQCLLPVVATSILLLGCLEQEVDVDIVPKGPFLAVYGVIHPDSLVSVWITQTKSVFDSSVVKPITHATVVLSEDGQAREPLRLVDAISGEYRATFRAQAGATYDLRVQADGFPAATATTQVPIPVPLTSVAYEVNRINESPTNCSGNGCATFYNQYEIAVTFTDPSNETHYYSVSGYFTYLDERYEPELSTIDTLMGEEFTTEVSSDRLFNGQVHTFRVSTENELEQVVSLTIGLRTVHPEWQRYQSSKRAQGRGNFGFNEPIKIYQNIAGGYGIFSSYSQNTVVIRLD